MDSLNHLLSITRWTVKHLMALMYTFTQNHEVLYRCEKTLPQMRRKTTTCRPPSNIAGRCIQCRHWCNSFVISIPTAILKWNFLPQLRLMSIIFQHKMQWYDRRHRFGHRDSLVPSIKSLSEPVLAWTKVEHLTHLEAKTYLPTQWWASLG